MHACSIEGQVVTRHAAQASVFGEWRKLVNIVKLGSITLNGASYTVVRFDTKTGKPRDAINSPAGAWLVSQGEVLPLNLGATA